MKSYKYFRKLFCVCLITPLYIVGCASPSGTLNLTKGLSRTDAAIISLIPRMDYSCKFNSVGDRDITNNPSKVIVPPGDNMVDISCRSIFSSFPIYIGGSLIFKAEAGREYEVYLEDMCLKIRDSHAGKILDAYCH